MFPPRIMKEWKSQGWTVFDKPVEFDVIEEHLSGPIRSYEFKRCYAMTGKFKSSKSFISEKNPGLQACGFIAFKKRK